MTHLAKRKIFEQKVLEKHKKPIKIIIFDKRGNGDFKEYYQTTANWKSSGHIRLTSYDAVIDALADYYRITESSTSPYVLCHKNGEWLKKEGYETMLRRLFQSLGYKITNNHALRKSLNSNILIPAGIDVTDRAAMLGHSVETNLRNYSFTKRDNIETLIDTLNSINTQKNKAWEPDGNQLFY